MTDNKTSTLLSDVSVEGDIVEKDKIIIDARINGNIKSEDVETHPNSNIKGNIKSEKAILGGKIKGNINSNNIKIRKIVFCSVVPNTYKRIKICCQHSCDW